MKKINLAITGCMGRMGQQIIKSAKSDKNFKIVALTENRIINKKIHGIKPSLNNIEAFKRANLIIDFTVPKCTFEVLKIASKLKKRVVIGTTGFSKKEENLIKKYSKKIPILRAGNMSLGINLLMYLTEIASKSLGNNFLSKVFEIHHKHKKDAPSGTALSLGDYAALGRKTSLNKSKILDRTKKLSSRKKGDIGFSVTRGGEIAGEHTVSFIGENDRIDLVHKANNRSIFVKGALDAAIFLSKKKSGFYTMNDLLFNK